MSVQFTIAASGQVVSSMPQSSTLRDARVESCVAGAIRRWEFPKPLYGGKVTVESPFMFTPDADDDGTWPPPAPEPPAPPSQWIVTLDLVRQAGPLADRIEKIARTLEQPTLSHPSALGWWLAQRARREPGLPVDAVVLAGELLRAAGANEDARRVLSERAPDARRDIAALLERWGAAAEATRLLRIE